LRFGEEFPAKNPTSGVLPIVTLIATSSKKLQSSQPTRLQKSTFPM
jgi:hypothetical protein